VHTNELGLHGTKRKQEEEDDEMKTGKEQMEGTDQLALRIKIREVLFLKFTILKSNVPVIMT
jgi:hypothetical protein